MKALTQRNALLISQGCKMMGSFTEGIIYIQEQLYCKDFKEIDKFAKWLDENSHRASAEMPFIESNLPTLFKLSKVELKEIKI
jgi:hypothetical protein